MNALAKLLNKDYSKFSSQYQVDGYIRELREQCRLLQIRNDFLLKTESYMPFIETTNIPLNDTKVEHVEHVEHSYVAVTMTLDPSKFPQLMFTPDYDQIKYFKKIISKIIIDGDIPHLYGCFEKHANGNIHTHLMVPLYATPSNIRELADKIKPFLTDKARNKRAVLIKPVTDTSGWLNYINKEVNFKEFIEYNVLKKTLENI